MPTRPFAYFSPANPNRRRALSLSAALSIAVGTLYAGASGCAPTAFTFQETDDTSSSSSATSNGTTTSSGGGAGGSGTSTSGGGAGATSSSSSTSGAPENCPPSYSCAPPIPQGWTGYDIILVDPAGGPKPACPLGDMPPKLNASPVAQAHTCTACGGCSRINAGCTSPEMTCWVGANDCMNGSATTFTPALNAGCVNDTNFMGAEGTLAGCKITANATVNNPGQCVVNNDATPVKPGTFNEDVHTCDAITGPVCGTNKTCVTSPFAGQQICVHKSGSDACPAEFPNSVQAYGGALDTRDCSACGCAAITGCSGGKITVYDLLGCDAMGAAVVIDNNACTAADALFDVSAVSFMHELATPMDPQQCTGGNPTGSLMPTSPVKYCCL